MSIPHTLKNIVASGHGPQIWAFKNGFIVTAFADLVCVLSFLVFVAHGRNLREASREKYRVYVGEKKAAGLVH